MFEQVEPPKFYLLVKYALHIMAIHILTFKSLGYKSQQPSINDHGILRDFVV